MKRYGFFIIISLIVVSTVMAVVLIKMRRPRQVHVDRDFKRITKYIQMHLGEEITVRKIRQALLINEKRFHKIFALQTSRQPIEVNIYIRRHSFAFSWHDSCNLKSFDNYHIREQPRAPASILKGIAVYTTNILIGLLLKCCCLSYLKTCNQYSIDSLLLK